MDRSPPTPDAQEMRYEVIVLPEAESDIEEAIHWYEEQADHLGIEFFLAVEDSLSGIREHPLSYQIIYQQVRRVVLRRFPYEILYRVVENSVIVFACFHAKRDPQKWIDRL